jgi:hypothetical protein
MSVKFFQGAGNNSTPFNSMLKEYDRIIGMQNKENRTWRVIAIVSLSAFFISLGLLLYAIKLPKTVPMVITVSDFGEAKYVGEVSRLSYDNINVPEIAIQFQIRKFIINMRTINSDATVMKQNINNLYTMLTTATAQKVSTMLRSENPFSDFGKFKRAAVIESLLKLSNEAYQVDFIETRMTQSGGILDRTRYRAIVSTELLEPSDNVKMENPLGIFISAFDISKVNTIE